MVGKLTYRLRGCPSRLDRAGVSKLLSDVLGDIAASDICIQSLASSLNQYEITPTKVATLMFKKLPSLIESRIGENEWDLIADGIEERLILDVHFLGWTPFNDPDSGQHEFDCIAISGLASHPFGSWQPKSSDRSYMWIRDTIPRALSNTRAIIYGYDTTLYKSTSFQSIKDIAKTFVEHLESKWYIRSGRPLLFLAHSLGGIVMKEAFGLLANRGGRGRMILQNIKGGIFFGVPSLGMENSHFYAMVKDQPNIKIVEQLSTGSDYLRSLDDQFSGLVSLWDVQMYWAYETQTSPTVKQDNGKFSRSGPHAILVTEASATCSLHGSHASSTFPINLSHSDMVKFGKEDDYMNTVLRKLEDICGGRVSQPRSRLPDTHNPQTSTLNPTRTMGDSGPHPGYTREMELDPDNIVKSLEIHGLNDRFRTVDENFEHTFDWIFDKDIHLTRWLEQECTGMFWIHGKPGSGKSTLMKFVYLSEKVKGILDRFASEAFRIPACFFFHDRGNSLQKSYRGLLQSILHQILEKNRALAVSITQDLRSRYLVSKIGSGFWTVEYLREYLSYVLRQSNVRIELFLFFDALDECEGDPEFIARFLRDLIKTISPTNRLKILFSSRPWATFIREFQDIQSIQLQDHTKDDIRDYCAGCVDAKNEIISGRLRPLIPSIVGKADGVFLWVKLVMEDLAAEALQGKQDQELADVLDSIPQDLQEYYSRTIQRIPRKLLFECYVIFKTVLTNTSIEFLDLLGVVVCSRARTLEEAHQNFKELRSNLWPNKLKAKCMDAIHTVLINAPSSLIPDSLVSVIMDKRWNIEYQQTSRGISRELGETQKSLVIASTGNLLELIPNRLNRDNLLLCTPTLAHQTVREFVRDFDFEQFIPGYGSGNRLQENGWTFLAKYYLARHSLRSAGNALQMHELTTGTHLTDFIDGGLKVKSCIDADFQGWLARPLAFATEHNLQLYLEEKLRRDPNVLASTSEKLLSRDGWIVRINNIESQQQQQQRLFITQLLLDNGYNITKDPGAFENIMNRWCECFDNHFLSEFSEFSDWEYLEEKASILVESGQIRNILTAYLPMCRSYTHGNVQVQAIHIAKRPTLINSLLRHGVDVNATDTMGNTAVDHILDSWCNHIRACLRNRLTVGMKNHDEVVCWLYPGLRLLAEKGGVSKNTPKSVWEACIAQLECLGLDTAPIRECLGRVEFDEDGEPVNDIIIPEYESDAGPEYESDAGPEYESTRPLGRWARLKSKITKR